MIYYAICIVIYAIALCVGDINIKWKSWVNIEEYICIIIAGSILFINIFVWIKLKWKVLIKIINSIIGVVAIIVVLFNSYCNPYWNSVSLKDGTKLEVRHKLDLLTYEEAKEDVEYAVKYLKKVHPVYRTNSVKAVDKQKKIEMDRLKNNNRRCVQDVEESIQNIYTCMDDEHTYATLGEVTTYNSYKEESIKEFVSYTIDDEKNIAILTLDKCISNEFYDNCLKKMFKEIRKKNIKNVAVDLRKNGGGNSSVVDKFVKYLNVNEYSHVPYEERRGIFNIKSSQKKCNNEKHEKYVYNGNVYILTSENTYSAAMTFTEIINGNNLGVIIGESPGQPLNSYTNCVTFLTPNARVEINISSKQQFAINKDSTDEYIQPDISCNSDEAIEVLYEEIFNQ